MILQNRGMSAHDYHFVSRWRVAGTVKEVADVLIEPLELMRWWPSVYLEVKELDRGDPKTRVGARVDFYTKGFLPYTLRWQCRITESDYPNGFKLEASGDLSGQGTWSFVQDGGDVDVTYVWIVRADKPLLRWLSFVLRPAFAMNHAWAMAAGEEGMRLELSRRRAVSQEERARLPAPRPPTPRTTLGFVRYLSCRAAAAMRARKSSASSSEA